MLFDYHLSETNTYDVTAFGLYLWVERSRGFAGPKLGFSFIISLSEKLM